MKVGDLVRKVVGDGYIASAVVPLKCFGIVVQVSSSSGVNWACAKVDFGDYGVFWLRQSLLELLS